MQIEHVILIVFGVGFFQFNLTLMVLGILGYRIALLYGPAQEQKRRIPTLGQRLRRETAETGEAPAPIEGVNEWPEQEEEVAAEEAVTQFVGAAEATQATDRDKWWEEKREEGYSDDQIKEMEDSRVVPVFAAAE